MVLVDMNGANPDAVIRNLESIGLTSKYNSGSLTPMGINGPVTSPFLGIAEPGAAFLSPVIRGGRQKMSKTRFLTTRQRTTRRKTKSHRRTKRSKARRHH